MYIKTDGIVLREVAYQDSDKLLTVLTREYGKLTVRARGVRSSRSRSKAACQLLAYSEFTLLERGGRYVVTEATAKEMFPELRNDLELLSLASYFAQAADVLSPEGEENPPFVSLLLNALYALGRLGLPQKLVKRNDLNLSCSGSPAGNTNEVLPAAQRFGILHERGIRTAQVVRNSSAQPLQERFLLNPQPQQILRGAYQQLFVLA